MSRPAFWNTPVYAAFIGCICLVYDGCGSPKLNDVVERLRILNGLAPEYGGVQATFSASWLSKLLGGKLEAFPRPENIGALIVTLQHLAADENIAFFPGGADEWKELFRQTKKTAEQQARDGIFVLGESFTVVEASSGSLVMRWARPADTSETGLGPYRVQRADPIPLTPVELGYLMGLGPYGQILAVRGATLGVAAAQHEIAVILGCHPEHQAKAHSFLIGAAAAGYRPALALVNRCGGDALDRRLAQEQARALADDCANMRQAAEWAHHAFRSCVIKAQAY